MRYIINHVIVLVGLLHFSCSGGQVSKDGERYSTLVIYTDDNQYCNPEKEQERTERLLSNDSLYIFFESYFTSDTVDIKINDRISKTLYLTTNNSIGVADMIHYDIESVDHVEIQKNRGEALVIDLEDKTMNLWTVNFYNDTLRAQRRKFLSWYE